MKRKRQLKSTATIRSFLRLIKAQGYYIRIRDLPEWDQLSREATEKELLERWEAWVRRRRRGYK